MAKGRPRGEKKTVPAAARAMRGRFGTCAAPLRPARAPPLRRAWADRLRGRGGRARRGARHDMRARLRWAPLPRFVTLKQTSVCSTTKRGLDDQEGRRGDTTPVMGCGAAPAARERRRAVPRTVAPPGGPSAHHPAAARGRLRREGVRDPAPTERTRDADGRARASATPRDRWPARRTDARTDAPDVYVCEGGRWSALPSSSGARAPCASKAAMHSSSSAGK